MRHMSLCFGQFLSGAGLGLAIIRLCGYAINPLIGLGLALAGLGLTAMSLYL